MVDNAMAAVTRRRWNRDRMRQQLEVGEAVSDAAFKG